VASLHSGSLESLRERNRMRVVDALRRRGATLVVVSNWDLSLHDVLGATGLDRLVDHVVISAELGVAKPDPAIFAHALALVGVGADQALHVGDSVEADVAGARAAGIEVILLARAGERAPTGTRAIASLEQLLDEASKG